MPELSQEKIFKYLTAVLSLLAVVLLVKEIFFSANALIAPEIVFPMTEINVRTEVFDEFNVGGLTPFTVEDLTPFQTIALPELIGRDRPFEPYSIEEYNVALEALHTTSTATTTAPIATTTEEVATTTEE